MQVWNKRICAMLLCVCMVVGFLPLGAQAALVEDASPYLTQQMLLGDDLTFRLQGNVNYYFAEHAVATVAYGDRVDTYRLEDLTPDRNGQCAIAAELAAAQMTEDIVLTIRVGEVVVLQETYSIRDYLSALLNGSFGDQTKQLCLELLNYGAWAQKYFDHRPGDLANLGNEIEPQYAIAQERPGMELSGSVSGIEFYGTSVRFTSKTAVRYYFSGSTAGCKFTVDGVEYTPVSKDGLYYIEVPGVNPQDMETPMQVEVTDGTDTLAVSYVPLNFFVRSYHSATDETYRGLLQAAYSYFKTAATYAPEENEDLGQSGGTEETPAPGQDSENLILGFESYAQVTGAKLATGNMLGRMEINTDPSYITQGKASLKVCPQGDYGRLGMRPYFKLDLQDSTCSFNNFSGFKSISFDVYNAENEELHIAAAFMMGKSYESYFTTNRQSFALAPNAWTTCSYDLSLMDGYDFYDFSDVRYMIFEFLEQKQSKDDSTNTLYIDNLHAVAYAQGETPAMPEFSYSTGIDFETPGQEYLFAGQGITNRDADIERIVYGQTKTVTAPANGGTYGLRLRHESNYWPTFRIYFGETLAAGTELTFTAYGRITGGKSLYNNSIFEFSSGGDATAEFACDRWTELSITLPEDGEYIDLFWNIDRAVITSGYASGEVYIDNIMIAKYEPTGDIMEGYGFEEKGNAERFTGQGDATNDATIKRFSYEMLGISAPTDGGEYALKVSHSSSQTPTFRINFGKELAAGTTISFAAYVKTVSGYHSKKTSYFQYSDGTDATASFKFTQWTDLSITLPEDAEYIDLTWNYKISALLWKPVCELYIDNIKAVEPAVTVTGDILEGIDFEDRGNELLFTGIGKDQDAAIERISYADAGFSTPTDGGGYALKLSHNSHLYPTFQMYFGKTLPAGTIITFDAYGAFDGCLSSNQFNIEFTGDSGSGDVLWMRPKTWTTATITLGRNCDHLQFFYNIERGNGISGSVASYLLIDNVKAVEPAVISGDISQGLDFENEADAEFFAGQGMSQDATIKRVSYADAGMTAPANGGNYTLKLSHASNYWPTFRINFGKTLKAGTKITFMAYGRITSGTNRYNQSIFEFSSGSPGGSGNATAEFKCDQWVQLTITLSADAEYINLFWNYDRASITSSTASGEVYLDNISVTEP